MPSGTLAISKTRTTPQSYILTFIPYFDGAGPPRGSLTVHTVEDLRALLSSIGVVGPFQDLAVRDAIRDAVAVVRDVVVTQAFIDKHRL